MQMAFRNIPPELKLTIAELLDPKSCFRLAATSRENLKLFASMIAKSKQLWTRYNTINSHAAGRLVWDVAKDIVENPDIAQYIEDVSLPDSRQCTWEADNGPTGGTMHTLPPQVPEDLIQLYKEGARRIPVLEKILDEYNDYDTMYYGPHWDMEQTIRIGSDEPIAAFLISASPNLRVLRFTADFDHRQHEFPELIERTVKAYMDPARPLSLPFQHLKYAAVAHCDTEMCCSGRWAKLFLSLPSLQGFAAQMIGGHLKWRTQHPDDDDQEEFEVPWKSNVKQLLFMHSYFAADAVETLLSGIRALESFTYDAGGAYISYDGNWTPRRFVAALLKSASHSLEELVFTGDGDDYDGLDIDDVSFSGFQKLKTIRCGWGDLIGDMNNAGGDEPLPDGEFYNAEMFAKKECGLASRLPRSLEVLHIETRLDRDTDRQILFDMIKEKDKLLPNLKRIHVRVKKDPKFPNHVDGGGPSPALLDALNANGIEYDERPISTEPDNHPLYFLLDGQGSW